MISLPVQLSPSIRIGTFAIATFSSFCWTANMLADRPKMTISGGRLLLVVDCNRLVAVTSDINPQLEVQKVCEFRQCIAFKAPIFSTTLKDWSST
jgi:hypothetical protein